MTPIVCPDCEGVARFELDPCARCGGSGEVAFEPVPEDHKDFCESPIVRQGLPAHSRRRQHHERRYRAEQRAEDRPGEKTPG